VAHSRGETQHCWAHQCEEHARKDDRAGRDTRVGRSRRRARWRLVARRNLDDAAVLPRHRLFVRRRSCLRIRRAAAALPHDSVHSASIERSRIRDPCEQQERDEKCGSDAPNHESTCLDRAAHRPRCQDEASISMPFQRLVFGRRRRISCASSIARRKTCGKCVADRSSRLQCDVVWGRRVRGDAEIERSSSWVLVPIRHHWRGVRIERNRVRGCRRTPGHGRSRWSRGHGRCGRPRRRRCRSRPRWAGGNRLRDAHLRRQPALRQSLLPRRGMHSAARLLRRHSGRMRRESRLPLFRVRSLFTRLLRRHRERIRGLHLPLMSCQTGPCTPDSSRYRH